MEQTLSKTETYLLDLKQHLLIKPKYGEHMEAFMIVSILKEDELINEETYDLFVTEERNYGSMPCQLVDGVFDFKNIDCSKYHAANKPTTPEEKMYFAIYSKINLLLGNVGKKLTPKEERMKEREGDRLYRSLRRLFAKPFGFEWTNEETSFYNGKKIFVKYDLQTGRHRPFTDTELRALRQGHGVHEAGHSEFDYLPDYIDWQKEMASTSKQEYLDNLKYPQPWLEFFGNMGLDGRMERLIVLKTPSQQPFLDLNNYDWRFGDRYEGVGESNVNDFRHAYAHRVLGMEDMENWLPEAVELLESVQPMIDAIRTAPSTKDCVNQVTTLIQTVWPTLLEWMGESGQEPSEDDSFTESMTQGTWSESAEEASERSQSVMEHYDKPEDAEKTSGDTEGDTDGSSSENIEDSSPEEKKEQREQQKASMLRTLEKVLEKDLKEVESELSEVSTNELQVSFKGESGDISAKVQEQHIPEPSLERYKASFSKVERYVKPVSKELSALLAAVPEQPRRNVRSGRFMAGQAWRAIHCEDSHVFSKQLKGTPKEDAFIACMTDISGSTYSRLNNDVPIYEEMRRALALLLEASDRAGVLTEAYAFTEDDDTLVFRLKPTVASLTDSHRQSIGGIDPYYGNRDTVALKYMLDRVQLRTEGIRLAIMLSDGIPVFEDGEGPETIQRMVKDAEKQGIMVLCLFIGNHDVYTVQTVKAMYPGRVIAADKGIAKELQKHVKRIIRQQR